MTNSGFQQRIVAEMESWDAVRSSPHRFGGVEFRVGYREVGHIHGDTLVDVLLPKRIRDELVAAELASPHHVLPKTGWVSIYLNDEADVERALSVLRCSYDEIMTTRVSAGAKL